MKSILLRRNATNCFDQKYQSVPTYSGSIDPGLKAGATNMTSRRDFAILGVAIFNREFSEIKNLRTQNLLALRMETV